MLFLSDKLDKSIIINKINSYLKTTEDIIEISNQYHKNKISAYNNQKNFIVSLKSQGYVSYIINKKE